MGFLFACKRKSLLLKKIQSMRKFLSFFSIATALSFVSCGGESKGGETDSSDSTSTTENTDMDMSSMKEHDLSSAGLNAKIMVADEMTSNGEHFPVKDSSLLEGISWQVSVGEKYSVIIEEADDNTHGAGNKVANEKKRLETEGIFDLKFDVDKENVIMYEANLKAGAGSKPFYHVFGVAKIEGKDFIIRSNPAGEYNKGQAEKMLKTIMALQKGA